MDKGGRFSDTTQAGIMAGGTIADGLIDGLDPVDEFGTRSGAGATASGAVKGAMAGAALGPFGIAGGAVIGGITSFFGNKKAQEAKQQELTKRSDRAAVTRDNRVRARIADNPDLQFGNADAQMYKLGGTVKGVPSKKFSIGKMIPRSAGQAPDLLPDVAISPGKIARFEEGGEIDPKKPKKVSTKPLATDTLTTRRGNKIVDADLVKVKESTGIAWGSKKEYGDWLDTFASPLPTTSKSTVTYPYGKRGETMTQDEWDYVRSVRKYPDVYKDKVQGTDNFIPGEIYSSEVRNTLQEYRTKNKKMAAGGVIPTSSTTSKVVGPSHDKGGVKIPEAGIEVEGGETIAGDFVFSKELGFADIHDKIGKAMGRNEKRPLTVLNKKTQEALVRKEGFLKIYQEQTKKDMGLSNEIDNTADKIEQEQSTADVSMKFGGKIMAQGGQLPGDDVAEQFRKEEAAMKARAAKGEFNKPGGGDTYRAWQKDFQSRRVAAQQKINQAGIKQGRKATVETPAVTANRTALEAIGPSVIEPGKMPRDKTFVALYKNALQPVPKVEPITPKAPPAIKPAVTSPASVPTKKGIVSKTAKTSPIPKVQDAVPQLPPLPKRGINGPTGSPEVKLPKLATIPELPIAPAKDKKGASAGDVINAVAPFASNIANAFRRLPQPPSPEMDAELTPDLINLDADRAEAVRQRRGADKVAAGNLTSGNNISAVKAANLSQEIRSMGQINQAEQNLNTGIKNQFAQINSQIRNGNINRQNLQGTQQVERQLKQQQLDSENIADVGNKLQLIKRDKAAFANEDTKNLLTILADPTGATIRGAGTALKRIIKDPSVYDEVMKRGSELDAMNKEERKANLDWIRSQINTVSSSNGDVLNSTKMLSSDYKLNKDAERTRLAEERLKVSAAKTRTKK